MSKASHSLKQVNDLLRLSRLPAGEFYSRIADINADQDQISESSLLAIAEIVARDARGIATLGSDLKRAEDLQTREIAEQIAWAHSLG